jgi:putative nucleotidyltransferase with HDIG domain
MPVEALMNQYRVHAQAVMRAADRIARDVDLPNIDEILVCALLHDIGKLVLARAHPGYANATEARTSTPEERVRQERHALGMDHASLGGLLLARLGLPRQLTNTIAAHHICEARDDVATLVRLADMVAHHAQGEAVDRKVMLRLADVCGLPVAALRNVLFDLPHSGGSQRRRCEPSPLSTREAGVLRLLAEGKVYKEIAAELGISVSTVRTHLHNMYEKMHVGDRAQAVLRAAEMAWI